MLSSRANRGFTLVELMVGIALLAILLAIGGPGFSSWLQNTQVRTMSEAIQNGIQLSRAEAVRRNAQVRFELMSSLDNTCAPSTSGRNWVVSMDGANASCASTNMADAAAPVAPRMIQTRPGGDGSRNAVVAASQTNIIFNGLGRVTPVPGADITIDVTNPSGGACADLGGPMRCLRIVVTAGGQVRMCDPRAAFAGTSEGC
jgi:type IV fimbrial biogenesis protein FimT